MKENNFGGRNSGPYGGTENPVHSIKSETTACEPDHVLWLVYLGGYGSGGGGYGSRRY